MQGRFNTVANFIRKSSSIYYGSIPMTQALDISFDGTVQVQATGVAATGFTLTILGSAITSQYIEAGDDTAVFGSFTGITGFYTTVPSTQGTLDLMIVKDTGENVEALKSVISTEVAFFKTGRPVFFRNIGRVETSDATLFIENLSETITEQDLCYVSSPGKTYNIVRVTEIERVSGDTFVRCDLRIPTGRGFLE